MSHVGARGTGETRYTSTLLRFPIGYSYHTAKAFAYLFGGPSNEACNTYSCPL